MKLLRKSTAVGVIAVAFGTAPVAQADTICSPSWGSGIPQVCITVPLQTQQQAPPFASQNRP